MKPIIIFFIFSLIYLPAISQELIYSKPERHDIHGTNFGLIGKVNTNYLVFKLIDKKYFLDIYDNEMNLKNRVHLDFIPDNSIRVDLLGYSDFTYFIYQFQKSNIIYCVAAALDENGKMIKGPFEIDTTHVNFIADEKIYNVTYSEDKSKIMIYKIHRENDVFNFTTLLFNETLKLIHKSKIETLFEAEDNIFSDFFVDDSGNFVFTKCDHLGSTDYYYNLTLVTKSAQQDDFTLHATNFSGIYLDEINLKIDNTNKQYLINSLFYTKRNGNIQGLYTAVWDQKVDSFMLQYATPFDDSLRESAKSKVKSKLAFNNYVIREVIIKKNGGFILTAEDLTTGHERNNSWLPNYNYLYASFPYMFSSHNGNRGSESGFYKNIVILNFDDTVNLAWSKVILKSQSNVWWYDNYLSYFMMNRGNEIHVLLNELQRHKQVLYDQRIDADGKVSKKSLLRGLNMDYQLMPCFAKQISLHEVIIPCRFKNDICFAKIDF